MRRSICNNGSASSFLLMFCASIFVLCGVGGISETEACPYRGAANSRRRIGPFATHGRALQVRRWANNRGCVVSYTFPCYWGRTRGYCFNVFFQGRTQRQRCPVRGVPGSRRRIGPFLSYPRALWARRWAIGRGCLASKAYACYQRGTRGYCFTIYFRRGR